MRHIWEPCSIAFWMLFRIFVCICAISRQISSSAHSWKPFKLTLNSTSLFHKEICRWRQFYFCTNPTAVFEQPGVSSQDNQSGVHLTLAMTVLSIKQTRWKTLGQPRDLLWFSLETLSVFIHRERMFTTVPQKQKSDLFFHSKKQSIAITYLMDSNWGCGQISRSLHQQSD